MARVYVDENLPRSFVLGLRDSGHDVAYAGDTGKGRSDAWHFRQALDSERIMLTLDSDFYYLHGLWTTLETLKVVQVGHAGVLTAVQTKEFTVAGWLPEVQQKLTTGEALAGPMLAWHAAKAEWGQENRLPWGRLI